MQFPKPVYVTEVRIIPLGARVHADFPGGVRLGATNPSQFQIEFFVNDLGKPGLSTFESLGGFEYNQNGCINLECASSETVRKIPTDGLVLRGKAYKYTQVTRVHLNCNFRMVYNNNIGSLWHSNCKYSRTNNSASCYSITTSTAKYNCRCAADNLHKCH